MSPGIYQVKVPTPVAQPERPQEVNGTLMINAPDVKMRTEPSRSPSDVKPGVGTITPVSAPLLPAPVVLIPDSKDAQQRTPDSKPWQSSGDPRHPQLRALVTKVDGDEESHLSFGIIGIQWSRMIYPTITKVFPDTPAARADILPAD